MAWAIFTTPEDHAEMVSAFTQAGLTQGEWNRIRDYANAYLAGWNANTPLPADHPCYATDGPRTIIDPETGQEVFVPGMRTVVINHRTKAEFLTELTRLINRPQRDRIILRAYRDLMTNTPWYAVPEWPVPPGYFEGMTCG